jgi:NAD(P)-dependent dehydrogenase (short-subunit alcohol dehydrogenase family)
MQKSRIAVVTGGGTGIGRGVAHALQDAGMRVRCVGLDADPDLPDVFEFKAVDVTSAHDVRAATEDLDTVAVLVNAAGVIKHQMREFEPDHFRTVVDINLNGAQRMIAELQDKLTGSRGAIVNIASMWSYFGSPKNPAYSASKAGVVGLTRSYAVALAQHGVRVNAVAPGWIRTKLSAGALDDPQRSEAILKRLPLACWGTVDDVARVVHFLCSDSARYITGAVIPVDGGYSIA